jgi:enoyl-CoA hydratase/carnithine racemase
VAGHIAFDLDTAPGGSRRLARVTIAQPARRNAISQAMARELAAVFDRIAADSSVGCVLLTGEGALAFSAGADITEFGDQRGNPEVARHFDAVFQGAADAIGRCPQPVVAAIRGACVGGGLQMAMQCDVRIAGQSARFGVPVNKLGFAAAWGEIAPMVRIAGAPFTLELLLEGSIVGSARAVRAGLVNRVVDDDAVLATAEAAAVRVLAGAPQVARWHKQFVRRLADPKELSEAEIAEAYLGFGSADYAEGRSAFADKRQPRFTGQ